MPINITQSQNIQIDNGFIGSVGGENLTEATTKQINALLIARGEMFKDEWVKVLNEKKVIASGNIEDVGLEVVENGNSVTLNISYAYYAKFVDKGVKGVRSSRNAPNSPYQFKNFGMSADGRESIKKWLSSAKAKVSSKDVKKYGAVRTERKFKKISDFDSKVETTIFNIKKYGIKTSNFIDPVLTKTLQGFEKELGEAIGKTITINIFK
jgi:hypothetical protein